MKRVRLTSKSRIAETQADGLFPGDVGNEERAKNYRKIDQYHKFEQTTNYELPDMRHEWKEDKRDENNIPVPKVAKIYAAAQNAIKLSMMLLGDKAPSKVVEAQARDFMRLGNDRLVASMQRWYETEDETEETPAAEETPAEAPVAAEEEPKAEEAPVEDKVEEAPATAEEAEAPAQTEVEKVEDAPAVAENDEVSDEELIDEAAEEAPATDDEEIELNDEATEGLNTEVDFDGDVDDGEVKADSELESIFEDDAEAENDNNEVVARVASKKKAGIKRISAQPKLVRVASKKADELESIWERIDAPRI